MKYLKKFNESSESYYEEIYQDDPIINSDTNDEIEFTKNEVDDIISLYDKKIFSINLKGWTEGSVVFDGSIVHEIGIKDKFNTYAIYKYDDEWYILLTRYVNNNNWTYYKCDQFEGLLECLKDKTKVK